MKKFIICLLLGVSFMFTGKINVNALSVDDMANYTYEKEFIMNAYQSFMNEVGSVVTGDIFIYRNNNVDYVLGFYSNNYSYTNVCKGITGCVPETAFPQLTIFSYLNDTSQSKYNVDALTMSLKVGTSRIVKVDLQSNGKVGYRLNSDGMIIKEYPYQPEAGWPSFIFDKNFKFYTNAKIRFLRDSRFGEEFHGLLAGVKDNTQYEATNKPLSNGTWSDGDNPIRFVVDVSEIETSGDKQEGVEACEWQEGDIFAIVKYIGCWLKNIWISIKNFFVDLFKLLFVPSDSAFNSLQTAFHNFLPIDAFNQVKGLYDTVVNYKFDENNCPEFTIDYYGKQKIMDFSIFLPYRTIVHGIMIFICWFFFLRRIIRRFSSIIIAK